MKKQSILLLILLLDFTLICNLANAYNTAVNDATNDVIANFNLENFTLTKESFLDLVNRSNATYNCADLTEISIQNQPSLLEQNIIISINQNLSECSEIFNLSIYLYQNFEENDFDTIPAFLIYATGNLSANIIEYNIFNYTTLTWITNLSGIVIGQKSFALNLTNYLDRENYYGILAFFTIDNYTDLAYSDNLFKLEAEPTFGFGEFNFSININAIEAIREAIMQNLILITVYSISLIIIFTYLAKKSKRRIRK